MKLMSKITAVIMCLSLTAVLYACSAKKAEVKKPDSKVEQSGDTHNSDEKEDLASQSEYEWAKIPDYKEGYPTKDDVVEAYKSSAEAFKWFIMTSKPEIDEEDTFDNDGITYFKVKSDKVKNLDSLKIYMLTMFSYDITDLLMDYNDEVHRFIENDKGELYTLNFAYEPTGFSEDKGYEITKNSDTDYTLSVHYSLLNEDGSVKSDRVEKYEYEKVAGRWIFTSYRIFRQ